MTRRRIARVQRLAGSVRESVARRRAKQPAAPGRRTAAEFERRLDATRERLRREIPPPD